MSVLVTIPEHNIPEHRASKWEIPDQFTLCKNQWIPLR
jgi:hypothetical protein